LIRKRYSCKPGKVLAMRPERQQKAPGPKGIEETLRLRIETWQKPDSKWYVQINAAGWRWKLPEPAPSFARCLVIPPAEMP